MTRESKHKLIIAFCCGLAGVALMLGIDFAAGRTSTNDYCASCHVHPDADKSWKQSSHFLNASGTMADCAQCHLPPKDNYFHHMAAKAGTGMKDLMSYIFKDTEKIDWESRKDLEYASGIVFNESCLKCHHNLYPEGISDDGISAHLYYDEHAEELDLQCINCHLDVGHFNPNYTHQRLNGLIGSSSSELKEKFARATEVTSFESFEEHIPGTSVSLKMVAVPGGCFAMGSPENEPLRNENEGPQRQVTVSDFFMGEMEVTWDQYWAFYNETMSEGRTPPETIYKHNSTPGIDAVSGPTPPFGNPDQGWGMKDRPALTMTHYAAETFCQWLSLKTGKHYRLPTEAEWEYAARGGSPTPYFFEGNPRKFSSKGFLKGIFKPDTAVINRYVVYALNSRNRTHTPDKVAPNPLGLKNMLGNVMEYCSDWYAEDAYSSLKDGVVDPKGPESGTEHVVRGGLYNSDAAEVRSASRASTSHDAWLKTDPQKPKSIWWYSDIKGIGFRVVCDLPETIK